MLVEKKVVPLQRKTQAGCSSARLEYASGGRVVAGSNPVTPTGKSLENQMIFEAFAFCVYCKVVRLSRNKGSPVKVGGLI